MAVKSLPIDLNSVVRPVSRPATDLDESVELAASLQACAELQYAYSYFNDAFWDGTLPSVIFDYTRKKSTLGHFAPERFRRVDGVRASELALNPSYLAVRSLRDSLSTLVHEQVHVWRHYFGPLNRRGGKGFGGYHDTVWRDEMLRIGLVPSDTGEPGGKMLGYRMSHYIEEGGLFDRVCSDLLATGFRINWADQITDEKADDLTANLKSKKKRDRIKFTCPSCGQNAWARPAARLDCGECRRSLLAAEVVR